MLFPHNGAYGSWWLGDSAHYVAYGAYGLLARRFSFVGWWPACFRLRKRRCNSTVGVELEEPCCIASLSRVLSPSRPVRTDSGNCAGMAKLGGGFFVLYAVEGTALVERADALPVQGS